MKYILILTTSIFVLAGCKKDKIDTTTIRIEKTEVTSGSNVFSTFFSYDAQGRLIKTSGKTNNEAEVTTATITYSGNEVIIQRPLINNTNFSETHEIRYQLNAEKKPILRIETGTRNFNIAPTVQHDYYKYESDYQYNAAGYLIKINKSSYDSTHLSQPLGTSIQTASASSVTDFTITANNLSSVRSTTQIVNEIINTGGGNLNFTDNKIQVWDFGYDMKFSNKTDYLNNFLLSDLEIFQMEWFPYAAGVTYVPDLITYNESVNGQNTINVTNQFEYTYNKYGFISTVKYKNNPSPVKIFYNKKLTACYF